MSEQPTHARPTASVYVDGLNLYRRLLAGRPELKWLDIEALAEHLLPEYDIVRVRYFTAVIKALPGADATSPQRQQAYLRALRSLPRTSVELGKFRIDPRVMRVHPTEWEADGSPRRVRVKKTEEKGSDVALASRLLVDAMHGDSDLYAVLTNDSDLVMPLRLVRDDLKRQVGLLSPLQPKRASNELKQTNPSLHRQVTLEAVAACQLPDDLRDDAGTIHRPPKWSENSEGPAEAGPSNQ
ncbi:MAG: NYN domain-containing protein [Nocardioides sp.]|nr:NYN domain-containing protein [Nocardioides sp.]